MDEMCNVVFYGAVTKVITDSDDIYNIKVGDACVGFFSFPPGSLRQERDEMKGQCNFQCLMGSFNVAGTHYHSWDLNYRGDARDVTLSAYSASMGLDLAVVFKDPSGSIIPNISHLSDLAKISYWSWDSVSFHLLADPGQPRLEAEGTRDA